MKEDKGKEGKRAAGEGARAGRYTGSMSVMLP